MRWIGTRWRVKKIKHLRLFYLTKRWWYTYRDYTYIVVPSLLHFRNYYFYTYYNMVIETHRPKKRRDLSPYTIHHSCPVLTGMRSITHGFIACTGCTSTLFDAILRDITTNTDARSHIIIVIFYKVAQRSGARIQYTFARAVKLSRARVTTALTRGHRFNTAAPVRWVYNATRITLKRRI